ncbi:MAG TPA: hypothetical protein VMU01_07100 [Rhizomicrobium sp.]|nr:hypothetical protein [Rhizomicrobium sp.]
MKVAQGVQFARGRGAERDPAMSKNLLEMGIARRGFKGHGDHFWFHIRGAVEDEHTRAADGGFEYAVIGFSNVVLENASGKVK